MVFQSSRLIICISFHLSVFRALLISPSSLQQLFLQPDNRPNWKYKISHHSITYSKSTWQYILFKMVVYFNKTTFECSILTEYFFHCCAAYVTDHRINTCISIISPMIRDQHPQPLPGQRRSPTSLCCLWYNRITQPMHNPSNSCSS